MEISVEEFKPVELITVKGRVDSIESARLAKALEAASQRGRRTVVVDMSQVEYMSSAGFRALGDAQRSSQRHGRCEVILAQVPSNIREALELVGFTEYFTILDSVSAAMEFAAKPPPGDSASSNRPTSPIR
jgi:anti-anti-sigma factor